MASPSGNPRPKSRIPWPRIFAEAVAIVVSILLAFGIQAWWAFRQDRAAEREIIGRLITDVQADTLGIDQGLGAIAEKEARLSRVDSVLREPGASPKDPVGFLGDVAGAAVYGWNQYVPRSVTFDELLGSGEFALIRDSGLREELSNYYHEQDGAQNRIDERETEFPAVSYELVPRSSEFEVASGLSLAETNEVVSDVLEGLSRVQVRAEVNFAQFVVEIFTRWREQAGELLDALESYRRMID